MAPSFADLKSKAFQAKDATVSKISSTKDRYTSHSSKNLDIMDPEYQRAKPPPLPPTQAKPAPKFAPPPSANRPSTTNSNAPPPPPASRNTRPDVVPTAVPPPPPSRPNPPVRRTESTEIDWANLSPEDKRIFFSWLDEFFARYLNKPIPSSNKSKNPFLNLAARNSSQPGSLANLGNVGSPAPAVPGPPKIALWSKPRPSPNESRSSFSDATDLAMTYPPESTHGSAALDIAHYFHPSTHWDSAWYATNPPSAPPVFSPGDTWQMSSQTHGTNQESWYGVVSQDLSVCWCTVSFSTVGSSDPNRVRRGARYLPRPMSLDQQTLIDAHTTYGETIASFAEMYVESRQYCARGECWDLAAEALKCFEQYDYVPKPIPSLSHTHGHLIAWFRVENGKRAGRWRGGDDRVRRGDIVQWRSVKIMMDVPGSGRGMGMLGAPDHTSIVVQDTIPLRRPTDGESFMPEELGSLEVVEQSVSTSLLPKREHYDLGGLDMGEVWIYRPIGMKVYLGTEFCATCPDDVDALTL